MKRLRKLVTFSLDDRKFALYVSAVQRIIRVVEVTALPKAPEIVVGIINLQGNGHSRIRHPDAFPPARKGGAAR